MDGILNRMVIPPWAGKASAILEVPPFIAERTSLYKWRGSRSWKGRYSYFRAI
jgi:hypothetical protein